MDHMRISGIEPSSVILSQRKKLKKLKDIAPKVSSNTSDHHLLLCVTNIETFTQKPIERNASTDVSTTRIKWDKVDKDLYSAMVSKGLEDSSIPTNMCTAREIDSSITSINAVLTSAAVLCGGGKKKVTHSKKRRKNRMWNDDIKRATVENKGHSLTTLTFQ